MRNPFVCRAGGVVSADIAVPDHAKEVAFYSKVLTTGESPLWQEDLMNNLGTPIIGVGERVPAYESLPLQWMPHIQVADVAASVQKAVELGGAELMHGKAEDGSSMWACIADTDGAAFGIIPPADEANVPDLATRQGRIGWLALHVPDSVKSREFYEQVIGWSGKDNEDSAQDGIAILLEHDNGVAAAGIGAGSTEGNSVPPLWIIYLPVADLDESLKRVRVSEGQVVSECTLTRSAVIKDPVGVFIGLQQD